MNPGTPSSQQAYVYDLSPLTKCNENAYANAQSSSSVFKPMLLTPVRERIYATEQPAASYLNSNGKPAGGDTAFQLYCQQNLSPINGGLIGAGGVHPRTAAAAAAATAHLTLTPSASSAFSRSYKFSSAQKGQQANGGGSLASPSSVSAALVNRFNNPSSQLQPQSIERVGLVQLSPAVSEGQSSSVNHPSKQPNNLLRLPPAQQLLLHQAQPSSTTNTSSDRFYLFSSPVFKVKVTSRTQLDQLLDSSEQMQKECIDDFNFLGFRSRSAASKSALLVQSQPPSSVQTTAMPVKVSGTANPAGNISGVAIGGSGDYKRVIKFDEEEEEEEEEGEEAELQVNSQVRQQQPATLLAASTTASHFKPIAAISPAPKKVKMNADGEEQSNLDDKENQVSLFESTTPFYHPIDLFNGTAYPPYLPLPPFLGAANPEPKTTGGSKKKAAAAAVRVASIELGKQQSTKCAADTSAATIIVEDITLYKQITEKDQTMEEEEGEVDGDLHTPIGKKKLRKSLSITDSEVLRSAVTGQNVSAEGGAVSSSTVSSRKVVAKSSMKVNEKREKMVANGKTILLTAEKDSKSSTNNIVTSETTTATAESSVKVDSGNPSSAPPNMSTHTQCEKKICCNCKRTKCLKLYCECFAASRVCEGCTCQGCFNRPEFEKMIQEARKAILDRNNSAFDPKIDSQAAAEVGIENEQKAHSKGCNCKRSNCLKKYCECFQLGVKCTKLCKCENCKNTGSFSGDYPHPSASDMVEDIYAPHPASRIILLQQQQLLHLETDSKIENAGEEREESYNNNENNFAIDAAGTAAALNPYEYYYNAEGYYPYYFPYAATGHPNSASQCPPEVYQQYYDDYYAFYANQGVYNLQEELLLPVDGKEAEAVASKKPEENVKSSRRGNSNNNRKIIVESLQDRTVSSRKRGGVTSTVKAATAASTTAPASSQIEETKKVVADDKKQTQFAGDELKEASMKLDFSNEMKPLVVEIAPSVATAKTDSAIKEQEGITTALSELKAPASGVKSEKGEHQIEAKTRTSSRKSVKTPEITISQPIEDKKAPVKSTEALRRSSARKKGESMKDSGNQQSASEISSKVQEEGQVKAKKVSI